MGRASHRLFLIHRKPQRHPSRPLRAGGWPGSLVDFYSNRCGPCRALAPVLEAMATEANGRFKIVKVDTDDQLDLAIEYGVTALPTLLIFKGGKVKAQPRGHPTG